MNRLCHVPDNLGSDSTLIDTPNTPARNLAKAELAPGFDVVKWPPTPLSLDGVESTCLENDNTTAIEI